LLLLPCSAISLSTSRCFSAQPFLVAPLLSHSSSVIFHWYTAQPFLITVVLIHSSFITVLRHSSLLQCSVIPRATVLSQSSFALVLSHSSFALVLSNSSFAIMLSHFSLLQCSVVPHLHCAHPFLVATVLSHFSIIHTLPRCYSTTATAHWLAHGEHVLQPTCYGLLLQYYVLQYHSQGSRPCGSAGSRCAKGRSVGG
jgi:hypothetical protein